MGELNAPGVIPDAERVLSVARKSLSSEDEPDKVISKFYLMVLARHLTKQPGDSNFLIEFADPDDPSKGGNGFGIVTCMEDLCWSDIALAADSQRPEGGRLDGIGSFDKYWEHCQDAQHVKSRDGRLAKQGLTIPAPVVSSPVPVSGSSSGAGPSRLPASVGEYHSHGLTDRDVNLPDVKPSMSARGRQSQIPSHAKIIEIDDDDDDDDDIEFLGSNEPQVQIVDDNEVKAAPSSQHSGPASSQSRSQASQQPSWVTRWRRMTIAEMNNAMTIEKDQLKAAKPFSMDLQRAVKTRLEEMRLVGRSRGIKPWNPPGAGVYHAIPNYRVHPNLEGTFTKPDVTPIAADTVAGPSSVAMPNPIASAPPSMPGAFNFPGWQAIWANVALGERMKWLQDEFNLLRAFYNSPRPRDLSLDRLVLNRFTEVNQQLRLGRLNAWQPMAAGLLAALPQLREATHPALRAFLPSVAPGSDAYDFVMDEEWDRPRTGKDLQTFFQDSLADFNEDATVEEGLKVLNLADLQARLPGARFALMAHQVLGVSFMVNREARTSGSRGGLLCDAMGLGKTVQCIGLMLCRNERPPDFRKSPQLIVAPVALLEQWKTEIETKTDNVFKVHIHHGTGKLKSAAAMKKYDVIITTFGTLSSESGLRNKKQRKAHRNNRDSGSDSADDDVASRPKPKGPLFMIKWFRAIIDEAHTARNKQTMVAKSLLTLDVLHPWILTGTPVVNSLADLGTALAFIGAMDPDDFRKEVARMEKKAPKVAAKRCQAILRPLMIRRNKDTEINGQKIIKLPPKHTNMEVLDFEPEERAIYSAIEQRAKVRVNKFIKQGNLMKNYSVVLVLLTRLRQCVNHPWLLRRKPGETAQMDDLVVDDDAFGGDTNMNELRVNNADEYGRAVGLVGPTIVESMKNKLEERYEKMTDENADGQEQDLECSVCYEPFDGTELITPCCHIYCKTCVQNIFSQPLRDQGELTDEQVGSGCRACPLCRAVLVPGRTFRAAALFQPPQDTKPDVSEAEEEEEEEMKADRKGKKRASSGRDDFFEKKPRTIKGKEKADCDDEHEVDETITPSSKMKQILFLVQGYLAENPNNKILIFSQFVQFLDLLGSYLESHGMTTIDYRGSMSQGDRAEAVRKFDRPPEVATPISVMLLSTKAGGVGLNLIMASKVIMCDLAWNPATENQAVDRAHRIGQTNEVSVERLVISNTVEDRLLEIQEAKGLLADGAMGEGEIGSLGRLTLENIRRLFALDRDDD